MVTHKVSSTLQKVINANLCMIKPIVRYATKKFCKAADCLVKIRQNAYSSPTFSGALMSCMQMLF
ncbi:hypothetical protein Q7C_1892 [Methylophaga frappieri]|uniref:Uncharacterized protein n=1 Tax=Methylophaga frappieri (strain ATCC BAA-2434 / DSM 25690 / JAM7) TaxID=754477 RepID=I1YJE0_METFJ|nr:hypothetical protein Q7C_1892 [Methylophaga frappieri]